MISETWKSVFGQDHAQLKCQAPILISLEPTKLLEFKEAGGARRLRYAYFISRAERPEGCGVRSLPFLCVSSSAVNHKPEPPHFLVTVL
jgi:hypothetical protein